MSIVISDTSMKKYQYLIGLTEAPDDTDDKYLEDDEADDTAETTSDDTNEEEKSTDYTEDDSGNPEETDSGEGEININPDDNTNTNDSSYIEDDNAEDTAETNKQDSNEDDSSDNPDDTNTDDEGSNIDGDSETTNSDDTTGAESDDSNSAENISDQDSKIKSLTLLSNYIALYKAIKGAIEKINSVDRNNIIIITVFDRVIDSLTTLSSLVYKYVLYYFEKSSYEINLYNYRYFIEAFRVSIELLKKVNTCNSKE